MKKLKKGLFKDQTGLSSILHLHGDFNIPTDDHPNMKKRFKSRLDQNQQSLEKIDEERLGSPVAPKLNFKSLLSDADHQYLTALPFVATDDELDMQNTSHPNGDINQT